MTTEYVSEPVGSGRGGVPWSRRATAKDVAALAQVSPQTVSRVANRANNVRPETRDRVLKAMEKVGYSPNAAARALRSGGSRTIGLIPHQLNSTGEANVVEAVSAAASARKYALSLADAPDGCADSLNAAIERLQQGVSGLVVLGLENIDIGKLRIPPHLPIVVADNRALSLPSVGFDQAGGAQLAVDHLLSLGHHTVHLIGGPEYSVHAQQREEGWRTSLTAAGRPIPKPYIGDWNPASGYEIGRRLAEDPTVTAIFAANDEMAAGLMRALHEVGKRIPQDVSVVGFDNVLAEYLWPPLTSIHQDFTQIGETLVRVLLDHTENHTRGITTQTTPIVIPARLVVRASSGPAPTTVVTSQF
ncbi:MAG: LacI family transcriptional regulator [Actinomycetaceae bacterium]|nr:LacI family transcriptional regulator [Actinomycetaceae bacterium]